MIGSFRSYRYGADAKWAFRRIDENVIRTELQDYEAQIVFRVKENMDSPDYRSKFLKEIAPHLDTGTLLPCWTAGCLLCLAVSSLNIVMIRRKIMSIWKGR